MTVICFNPQSIQSDMVIHVLTTHMRTFSCCNAFSNCLAITIHKSMELSWRSQDYSLHTYGLTPLTWFTPCKILTFTRYVQQRQWIEGSLLIKCFNWQSLLGISHNPKDQLSYPIPKRRSTQVNGPPTTW